MYNIVCYKCIEKHHQEYNVLHMHFLWCVHLITFILRYAFQSHIKFFIKIYILHPSSSCNDTFLKKCFIFCVWGWGEVCLSTEKWDFILISENVEFFCVI